MSLSNGLNLCLDNDKILVAQYSGSASKTAMNFSKVSTNDPGYKVQFGDVNIQNFKVYTEPDHLMGRVVDVLRDENQNYYITVETGSWLSKQELVVPVTQFNLTPTQSKIYLQNLVLEQDGDRKHYRVIHQPSYLAQPVVQSQNANLNTVEMPIEVSAPLEASAPLDAAVLAGQSVTRPPVTQPPVTQPQPSTQAEAEGLYTVPVQSAQPNSPLSGMAHLSSNSSETIRLLEERLVIDRHRRKIGEVVVRKEIETQIVEVPIHREKLVVEQIGSERKQLASIDLGQRVGAHPTGFTVSDSRHDGHDIGDTQFSQPAISLATAQRIIHQLMQAPQTQHSHVRLVFEDQELQNQYHHWLTERNGSPINSL